MRIVFAGTPDFAAVALKALLQTDHQIVGVYSQPDRPAGRGRKLTPSPVKQVALDAGIPVFQPLNFKDQEARDELAALAPDVMIVAAYGLILPKAVLDTPRHGCLNIHASLLPRWRGAAPIQRAIAAGDSETGITIMQMDVGLDTGAMLLKSATPISSQDTGGSLHDRLADMGGEAIVTALDQLTQGTLDPEPQDDAQANYAHKLSKEEGHIDWSRPAQQIDQQIRAFFPWPGSYTDTSDDQRIRVHQVEVLTGDSPEAAPGTIVHRDRDGIDVRCGEGSLRILQLQLPGARAQSVNDLINGGKALLLVGQELH
ncbi:methionyl-tRNA formyltransferase [Marinobacter zhejiangensis]|uniref:Methionyl-tRNA formyltransferase n=1 Tax=Marinobacter zhejiangensis TaxID=488535 RepID=A0A1I4LSL5_9GAMM|nr:methionyl-tRNA formyltransferase [Marinobacter zhejiangensis]SFL93891.1 methionyl-tRNA formyltransferase [Marinobacter zhejiangensis]